MASKHKFDLRKKGRKRICKAGSRYLIDANIHPFLDNMALALLTLKKGGVREPHWHPNASEMAYCVQGKALVTFFSPGNNHDTFTLSAGEVMYVPKGYLHHIENIHSGDSKFILAYDNGAPEDLDLSESVGSMSAYVLSSTFSGRQEDFAKVKKNAIDVFISKRKSIVKLKTSSTPNQHKIDLERINPQIASKAGSARTATSRNFPLLDKLALFSLRIAKKGVREPHWHPNATELNYVVKGKARLTIFSPGGKTDTFDLSEGQGSIIPAGYFHHIENIGTSELHMTVYFNNATPSDIGLSGALSAYSKEVLASIFSIEESFFEKMHKFQEDRMIVVGGG